MGDEERKGVYNRRPKIFPRFRTLKAVYESMCAPGHIFLDWNAVASPVLQLLTHSTEIDVSEIWVEVSDCLKTKVSLCSQDG